MNSVYLGLGVGQELAEDLVEKASTSSIQYSYSLHKIPAAAEDQHKAKAKHSSPGDITEVKCDPFRTTLKRELQ